MLRLKFLLNFLLTLFTKVVYRSSFNSFTNELSISSRIYDSTVGNHNYFGPGVVINNTEISNYCSIAPNVVIGGMEHDYTNYSTSTKLYRHIDYQRTIIQDDVWVGANSVIRTGLTVGRGSIIGANSVVLKDVPPMAIVVGNPATIMKYRFTDFSAEKTFMEVDFSDTPENILKSLDDQ